MTAKAASSRCCRCSAVKRAPRPVIVAVGLFGAALIYGDGAITPAISVLSALEGLDIATPGVRALCPPGCGADPHCAVRDPAAGHRPDRPGIRSDHGALVRDHRGARRLGHCAAPGGAGGDRSRATGSAYLFSGGAAGFFVLGAVFLCVTGAEALYADMGHFGAGPIRLAWSAVVFPSLVLNYAGQAALVLEGAPIVGQHLLPAVPVRSCWCRWWCSPRWRRSSPASRSSPGRFR